MPGTFLSGVRLPFAEAPPAVRSVVLPLVGGTIDTVRDARGGMSQGVAAVVTGPAGSVFVKAVARQVNEFAFSMVPAEARSTSALPAHPGLPRVLACETVPARDDEWAVLVLTAFDGQTPHHPWQGDEMRRVLDAWAEVQPLVHATEVPDGKVSDIGDFLSRWDVIAADADDPWQARAVRWAEPCRQLALAAGTPTVATHLDLRADNVVVGSRVGFVDWAHLSLAAPWTDVLLLVLDMVGSGADVDALWRTHPATRELGTDMLVTGAAALAGALHVTAARPVPGLPHRTSWARAMADTLIDFAETRR